MTSVHDEVECKYDADADTDVGGLLAAAVEQVPGLALRDSPSQQHLEATYFDTVDLRLARARVTLRRRTGGDDAGWHLKVPTADAARVEVGVALGRSTGTVPAALRRLVQARSLGADLVPVVRVTTDRTVHRLHGDDGQVLAEVADDLVSGTLLRGGDGDSPRGEVRWRELEVELVDGDRPVLDALDGALRDLGLRPAAARSKLARVMGERVEAQPQAVPGHDTEPTAGAVVLAYLAAQAEQLRSHDPLVRLDRPDAVHKMRVATRRLRSALRTFGPLLEADVVRPLRTDLKWLAGRLGVARDAEVLGERLAESAEETEQGGHSMEETVEGMRHAYRAAHDDVLVDLDSERHQRLLGALDALVGAPPFTEQAAQAAGQVLPARVAHSYRKVRSSVAAAAAASGHDRDHHLHDTRKAAKRARYAAEALADAFGPDAQRFAAAMEGVQEALGEHQDSVVLRERLATLAQEADPGTAFRYGRLHAREEARGERAVEEFEGLWSTASRKRLRRWLR